jgi:hypothetical protein
MHAVYFFKIFMITYPHFHWVSDPKVQAACSAESLMYTYETTHCYSPDGCFYLQGSFNIRNPTRLYGVMTRKTTLWIFIPLKTSNPRKEGRIRQLVDRSSEISWRLPTYSVCVLNYYLLEGFSVGTRPTAVVNPWTLPFISSHRFLLPHAPLNHRPGTAHVMPLYHFCPPHPPPPPHSSNCMWVVSSEPISGSWCTELTAISCTLFENKTCLEGLEEESRCSSTLSLTSVLDGGAWSMSPQRLYPRERDPVTTGWTPGPVWTGAESLATTGIRVPDRSTLIDGLYVGMETVIHSSV